MKIAIAILSRLSESLNKNLKNSQKINKMSIRDWGNAEKIQWKFEKVLVLSNICWNFEKKIS